MAFTLTYRDHAGLVTVIAWSPDGTRIASGSADQMVHVWQVV
jgi:WD40 repeat protein